MKTYPKKRLDITVESPLMARMLKLLDEAGVTGYTVVSALAGKGTSGAWHRDGVVGRAGSVVLIYCILDESKVDSVLQPVFALLAKQIGIVTVSDVQVVRPELF
jgi:PII-like signaling protein